MHNYINRFTCIAMMNKNCVMDEDDFIFYRNRKRTKTVVCGKHRA